MVKLNAINVSISPGLLDQIKTIVSAAGLVSLSVVIDVADACSYGTPIPFAKVVGELAKLIQDQADAAAKSEQFAQEAKKRAAAAAFQVYRNQV